MTSLFRRRKKDVNSTGSSSQNREDTTDQTSAAEEERSGLFIFHDCPSSQKDVIDVVAVHGLGGHWKYTWAGVSGKIWLKDFLPPQLRDAGITARVLSFGYDSDTAFSKAITDIDDVAGMLLDRLVGERQSSIEKSRPVLFVAHSLGGIVVKKSMVIAHERSQHYGGLLQHIRATLFLGVPHRGSDIAYWATFAANVLRFGQLGFQTNAAYVTALQRNSPAFANISTQFIERAAQLSIRTFFETERMGNQVIVDKDSATLLLPNEIAVGVAQSNHRTICKFDNQDSQRYRPVWRAIKDLAEHLLAVSADSMSDFTKRDDRMSKSKKTIFSVRYPRDKQFVNREYIFSEIDTGFCEYRPVALCGLGGTGKSQVAIEYAYRFHDQYPHGHVLWVYAANETRFVQAYQETARKLQLPGCDDPQVDSCQLVYEWLNETQDIPWLMILDNADSITNFLPTESEISAESAVSTYMTRYLPTSFGHSQCLLITTRSRDIGDYLSNGQPCVNVGSFKGQEAEELLYKKLRVYENTNPPETDKLMEMLGRIPLAITQAAAFINRNKISVQQYITELTTDKQNFMDYLSSDLQDHRREQGFPNSVFRTWKVSFDQIQKDHPRAAEILSLMAMLDGQKIPEDLIRRDDEKRVDFNTAIGTLDGYSMISKETGGETCAIHPLVQMSVQYILEQSGQTALCTRQALKLMAERFPTGEHKNTLVCESLLPHALTVLQHDIKSNLDAISRARLLHKIGWFAWRQGRYESARQDIQTAHQIRQQILGDDIKETLDSLDLMALVLQGQGKYEAAEEMNRRALAGSEKALGVEHPDTLTSVSNLALVLRYQGKYEVAEEMNRRALAGYEKALGVEHPDTLTSVNNLALVLQYQGKYEAAEEMNRRALAGREKALGVEHPDTLTSVGNLASVLQYQGKYEAAEEMNRRALAGYEKALGVEHPNTLTSVSNLAAVLQYQGKYEAAEEMNRRALAGSEKALGVEHPDTLTSVDNLAAVLQYQGKYEVAEEMNRRALAGSEKALGVEHPDTLTSVSNLALVLQYQGKYEVAEEMNRRALAGREKALGVEHPDTLTSVSNLAAVLQYQGKYEAAEEMNRRALAGSEKALGVEHPDTLTSVSNLAAVLQYQGKYEAAEEMNRRALAGSEKALGVEHPDTLTSVSNLAAVLQYQGKYEAAEEMNRRALAGREKALGVEHPDTLTSVSNLALVLRYQGKYEVAEEMNRRALGGREKALGVEHPDTLTSVGNLALVLQYQGKYEAAEEMNRRALAGSEKALGVEHPDTLTSVGNLALVLQYQGKYEVAEEMNRRALAGREKALGVEHPDTLTSVNNLASVLRYQGKYKAAEEMNRRALAGYEKALGFEHPDTLISVSNLALVLQYQGRYEAAEEMNRQALAGMEKVLGVEHPDTLASVYCLAHLLHTQRQFEESSILYQRAFSGYRNSLGLLHPTTLDCERHYLSMLKEKQIAEEV